MSRILLRLVEIAGAVKLDDLVVGAQAFVGVSHVGQHLVVRRLFLLLRLRDGEARARDFALVAIENRQLNLAEERSRAQRRRRACS